MTQNYFTTPNEIFSLGLTPGEFSVYSFLCRCENRRTHQCWPSYSAIGTATRMSVNTVRKHVCALVDKGLIRTEDTTVRTWNGLRRNGNLRYTILPQDKVRGSRALPRTGHTAPQCGSVRGFSSFRADLSAGVTFGPRG